MEKYLKNAVIKTLKAVLLILIPILVSYFLIQKYQAKLNIAQTLLAQIEAQFKGEKEKAELINTQTRTKVDEMKLNIDTIESHLRQTKDYLSMDLALLEFLNNIQPNLSLSLDKNKTIYRKNELVLPFVFKNYGKYNCSIEKISVELFEEDIDSGVQMKLNEAEDYSAKIFQGVPGVISPNIDRPFDLIIFLKGNPPRIISCNIKFFARTSRLITNSIIKIGGKEIRKIVNDKTLEEYSKMTLGYGLNQITYKF